MKTLPRHLFGLSLMAIVATLAVAPARAAVIGYWRFEGDATGFVADSSGNSFSLTKGDGDASTTYPTQVTGAGFDNPVPQNNLPNAKAASFDGGDWFSRADNAMFAVSDFTIEAYINKDLDDRGVIAAQWASTSNQRSWVLVVYETTGELTLSLSEDGTTVTTCGSGINIASGTNYFVAASFDESDKSTGVNFYVKNLATGVWSESTASHDINSLHNSTGSFNIGAYAEGGSRWWDGLIDEVRLSNTVLSQDRLLAVIPEPASFTLLSCGLAAFGLLARSRRRRR